MKKIVLVFGLLFILGCTETGSVEKAPTLEEQYAEITRVDLPRGFKVISTTPPNSKDLIEKTVVEINEKDCRVFYKSYGFKAVEDSVSPLIFGSKLMDSVYRLIPERNKFLHLYGKKAASAKYFKYNTENGANWVYLLDTTTCRLYCLISKADLNGYAR